MRLRGDLWLVVAVALAAVLSFLPRVRAHSGPGYALSFNGTNYISITTTGSVSGTFTVETWVRPADTNGATIFSTRVPGENTFDLQLNYGVGFHGDIGTGGFWLTTAADAPFAYTSNQWFHVAYVVTTTNYVIYANGQQIGSNSLMGGTPLLYNSSRPIITIATYFPGAAQFKGQIDEVRVWNVARTKSEIQSNMTVRLTGSESGLVNYYRFDEPNATGVAMLALDSSSHRLHGKLINRPFRIRSTAPLAETLVLNGPNPLTNECHFGFNDPGAGIAPRTITMGLAQDIALQPNGAILDWGAVAGVPASATNVEAIASGSAHSVALKTDGTVVAWGFNFLGQLNVPASATNGVAIAAGANHTLLLRADGSVVAWGDNANHETDVPPAATNVIAVAGGQYHSLALRADGTVVGWGTNDYGQISIPPGATNIVAIAAGPYSSVAIRSNGTVIAWGKDDFGETSVPAGITNLIAVYPSFYDTLGLGIDGTIVGWGNSDLLDFPPEATNVIAIGLGYYYCLALKADGSLVGWGLNNFGEGNIPTNINLQVGTFVDGNLDPNHTGIYAIRYSTSTNSLGVFSAATRTVVVQDTIPPSLALNGPSFVYAFKNGTYVDAGAVATDLCAGDLTSSIVVTGGVNLAVEGTNVLGFTITDASGNVSTTNRIVVIVVVPGDLNSDGIVSRSELDAVFTNYLRTSPWLLMTNVVGLGSSNVVFALTNSPDDVLNIEYSTNLLQWQSLGSVLPLYQFTDTNAHGTPQRFYRLRAP